MLIRIIFNQIPRYQFCKFISKKDWHSIRGNEDWSRYLDDLNINAETYRFSSTKEMMKYVKEEQEAEIYQKGIGQLLYNMGKTGLKDNEVIKKIEKQLYKFKGEFSSRMAFGSFYGFIALSIDNLYIQEFFDSEFKATSSTRPWYEAIEIIEACGKNTNLSKQYIHDLIKTQCAPLIIEEFPKSIKYSPGSLLKIFDALIKAQYFDQELFDPILNALIDCRKITNLDQWHSLLITLDKLNKEGDFPRQLDEQIKILENKLRNQNKYSWRYNVDQRKYLTIEELKNKRENQLQQPIGYHLFYPKGINEQYAKVKAQGNKESIEREKKLQQEQVLDDLLYDQFILEKLDKEQTSTKAKKKKGMREQQQELDEVDEEERQQVLQKDFVEVTEDITNTQETQNYDDDDFSLLEDRIKNAAERAKQRKLQSLKKRKGRKGKEIDDNIVIGNDE